jgi:hypothetical protein
MNIIFDEAAEIHKGKIQIATPEEVLEINFLFIQKLFVFNSSIVSKQHLKSV